ncbi:LOW QUALITY PROTEIN: hypothetical protein PAHAL_6G273100 [Panicum hallii]|uniref:Uncharacterized protein n=1 Tax=Panicum hallii TaxID=206008 RepID=A0A2T8IHR9_9POAL|nr:LOW QUALITY PROTEIN: hypothetical protein PAHAL_6G273100 [Panicum hallii]
MHQRLGSDTSPDHSRRRRDWWGRGTNNYCLCLPPARGPIYQVTFDAFMDAFSDHVNGTSILPDRRPSGARGADSGVHPGIPVPCAPQGQTLAVRPDNLYIPLAFFVLVVSEAERFRPIRTAVTQAWDDRAPQLIPLPTIKLVVNWAEISCALLACDHYGRTEQTFF